MIMTGPARLSLGFFLVAVSQYHATASYLDYDPLFRHQIQSRHQVQSIDDEHEPHERQPHKRGVPGNGASKGQTGDSQDDPESKDRAPRRCKPSRKKDTCQPSANPTSPPSSSSAPSLTPSAGPSNVPTTSPSAKPSSLPSSSTIPSTRPSSIPSGMPSQEPTTSPSTHPSLSAKPSTHPSTLPSLLPTKSQMPSSHSPSQAPSVIPSNSPSLSNAPTALLTVTNQRDNGVLDAACNEDPPSSGTIRAQQLAFTYNMYLTEEGVPTEAVPSIELQLHSAISRNFLTCQYEEMNLFDVVTVSSSPKDWATNVTCDTSKDPKPSVDGTVCVVVNAGIQLFVHFSSPSRHRQLEVTNASPEVLDAFEEFLRETMASGDYSGDEDVVQLSFQGFGNVPESPTNTGGIGGSGGAPSNPDGRVSGFQEGEDGVIGRRGGVAVGSTVLAVAAACLVLVAVLVLHTKRRSQDAYAKYLEDASVASGLSDDPNGTMPMSSEGKVRVHVLMGSDQGDGSVWCDDVDYDEWEAPSTPPPPPNSFKPIRVSRQHDVRTCSSATCPLCRDRSLAPIFLSLDDLELESELVPVELGPRRFVPDTSRVYQVSDTVLL